MTDKMREAFEKWAGDRGYSLDKYNGHYKDQRTIDAWWIWQSALERTPAAQSEQSERKDKPAECVNGCPDKQVCDYCQGAAAIMPCGASVTNVYDAGKKAAQSVPAAVMDSRCTYYSFAGSVCNKCGRIHDGGKSVPVVGEVVAYASPYHASEQFVAGTPCILVEAVNVNAYGKERGFPLVVQPTNSISAAELDRLQEGEGCAEAVLEAALVKFPDAPTEFECIGKMAAEVVRRYDAELERLRKDAELKASESSIACEALQAIIDLLPDSSVAQAKLIAIAAMTKQAAIAAEGEK